MPQSNYKKYVPDYIKVRKLYVKKSYNSYLFFYLEICNTKEQYLRKYWRKRSDIIITFLGRWQGMKLMTEPDGLLT